jgi:UDPglucose 6-dehydrogenase
LAKSGEEYGYHFGILNSVMSINDKQKSILIPKIKNYFKGDLKGKKIGLWGLAFKPDTDDIREAPALYLIEELLAAGAEITAFDPEAMSNVKELLGDKIKYALSSYEAAKNADALVIATEWQIFRTPDFNKLAQIMTDKVIFDGRNLYELEYMKALGFYYSSIGRTLVSK